MGQYQELLVEYLLNNPDEQSACDNLLSQVATETDSELTNRKNFRGHFTASIFVVSEQDNRVLMLHHNILKRYLQPGGHIEPSDQNPLMAAKRELVEETQIDAENLVYKCVNPLNPLVPFHISIHKIPENTLKNEKSHYHYDCQYLFLSSKDTQVIIDEKESSSFEWIEWDVFKQITGYQKIAQKIEDLRLQSH